MARRRRVASTLVQRAAVLDPGGHVPTDDPDTEFVNRVAALQALTSRTIAIATNIVGMSSSAKVAGLEVVQSDLAAEIAKVEQLIAGAPTSDAHSNDCLTRR